jgi:hypothetical protein
MSLPGIRDSSYFPSLLEPRRKAERALSAVVQESSTRPRHPGDRTGWAGSVRLTDEVCPEEVGKLRNAPSASTGIAEVV